MARHVRLCWEDDRAIVFTEGLNLGVKLRIVPVGVLDRGPQVIDDHGPGGAVKMPESILQTANETVGVLTVHRFAVASAREAQDDAEYVGPTASAVRRYNGRAGAKVHLRFLAGHAFHPPKRDGTGLLQTPDESADTVIAAPETVLIPQVLINPLTRKPLLQLRFNDLAERLTLAATGRDVTPLGRLQPGGRFGWF